MSDVPMLIGRDQALAFFVVCVILFVLLVLAALIRDIWRGGKGGGK